MNNEKKTAAFMKVYNTIQSVTNILQFETCEKMIEIYTRFEVGLGTDPTIALEKKQILEQFFNKKQAEFAA
jgi:hypothetical protein